MKNWIAYLIIAVILVAVELCYFRVAERFQIVDSPKSRSSHSKAVLRGGGIVFLFGIILFVCFFGVQYVWFLLGLLLVGVVSFWDDVRSLSDSVRLGAHFIAVLLVVYQLWGFQLNMWWWAPLVCVFCIGIINAYNFMDGVNGMTGAYSLVVILPLIYLNKLLGFVSEPLLVCTLLADLVFCFFNFRVRAKCFAGDVGSISMAFIVIFVIALLISKTKDFSFIILLAIYGIDTVLTIVHRMILRENLGEAHRKHAYQLMANELHIPHLLVSIIYALLQLVISAGLILLPVNHYVYSVCVIVFLCMAYVVFMKKYYHLHEEYLANLDKAQ